MRPRQDEQVRSGRAFRGGNSTRGCGRVTVSCTGPRRSEGRAGEEKGRGAELAVTLHARQKDAILYRRAHLGRGPPPETGATSGPGTRHADRLRAVSGLSSVSAWDGFVLLFTLFSL